MENTPRAITPWSSDYWKIPDYSFHTRGGLQHMLRLRGLKFGLRRTAEHYAKLMDRWERKAPDYKKMGDRSELRKIAKARGLGQERGRAPRVSKMSKSALIELLEEADENPQFNRLYQLPPELRCEIYRYYFLDLGPLMFKRVFQPPLTHASRLIRQESLPLFFEMFAFSVGLRPFMYPIAHPSSCHLPLHNGYLPRDLKFINATPDEYLAKITRLEFDLGPEYPFSIRDKRFDVQFKPGSSIVNVQETSGQLTFFGSTAVLTSEMFTNALRRSMNRVGQHCISRAVLYQLPEELRLLYREAMDPK